MKDKTPNSDRLTPPIFPPEVAEFARRTGSKGGKATLRKHRRDHYVRAANKRWGKRRKKR